MRPLFTLLFCLLFSSIVTGQQRPGARPAGSPQPAKPKGASPYVMKKDYDSSMTKLNNRIASVQNSVNGMRGSINAKDGDISTLQSQMKQVEEVLNSTNFKISLTSDSLNQTRFSMEEIQKGNEARFAEMKAESEKAGSKANYLFIALILALALPVVVWFLMNKQLKQMEHNFRKTGIEMQSLLEENQAAQQKNIQQLDQQIRLESRNNQHYTERMVNMMKEENAALRNELVKAKSTIQIITSELSDLHDRLNNKS